MGQSTDAILFYGYCWFDEHGDFTDDDWETSKQGKEEFGVEIGSHCSCDYPMPYIYISESEQRASRGDPERVNTEMVAAPHDVTAGWDNQLRAFIAKHQISLDKREYEDGPQGPGWFLVSNWC
jgi:hypothetical protein